MRQFAALLFACAVPALAQTADSYGYVLFWQDGDNPHAPAHVKTTQENANQTAAEAEMLTFCHSQDNTLPMRQRVQTGCFAITPVHNACAAAASARARGSLRPDNLVVVVKSSLKQAQTAALAQCATQYGHAAACEVETAYCSDAARY